MTNVNFFLRSYLCLFYIATLDVKKLYIILNKSMLVRQYRKTSKLNK